jgi:hypothetical protein
LIVYFVSFLAVYTDSSDDDFAGGMLNPQTYSLALEADSFSSRRWTPLTDVHSHGFHAIGASTSSPSSVGHPTCNDGDFEAGPSMLTDNMPAAPALPLDTGSRRLYPGMEF